MTRRITNNPLRTTGFFLFVICSALGGSFVTPCKNLFAQEQSDTTQADTLGEVVLYKAERIEYFVKKNEVFLIGKAEAEYQSTRVTADTLIFNTQTREIIARGSPVLYEGDQVIVGERMEYNLDSKKGVVTRGKTETEKGWFEGERTHLVEEGVLYIQDGTFTSCDLEEPHTWFAANRLKVMKDNMVIAEPVLFYVRGVPTFALPFWFFPIKKGRHSGILTPKFGLQSADGAFVRNLSYYWVVNDYSDLTFTLDLFEKRGVQYTAEGLYIVMPFFSGKIRTSYLDDLLIQRKRWRMNADHEQDLGQRMRLVGRADFESDENYDVNLDETRIVQLNRRLFSYLSLTKRWSIASMEGRLLQEQDLDKKTKSQTLPFVNFNLNQFHPFSSPLVVGYRTSYTNLRNVDSLITLRQTVTNSIPLSAPFTLIGQINLVPGVNLSTTSAHDSDSTWDHSGTLTNSLGLNTTLYGHSTFGFGKIQRFRHVLRPSLSYGRSQNFTYSSGELVDTMDSRESIFMSAGNEFQAQVKEEQGIKTLNIASLNLSTSYDLDSKKLSDISSLIQIDPTRDLGITFRGVHNPDTLLKDFQFTTSLDLHGAISVSEGKGEKKPLNLNLQSNYNYQREIEDDIQIWGSTGFWMTQNWKIGYSTRFDFETERFVEHKFNLYRDLHEWEASFNFDKIGERERVDFKLSMKIIPEIRLEKGIFGFFLP